jgi:hypothetical protein
LQIVKPIKRPIPPRNCFVRSKELGSHCNF